MPSAKTKVLIIKRYPNRRLYDTEASAYINIRQFIDRIKMGRTVKVVDTKTKRDLTRETLLLALVEEDRNGKLLPEWVILQMIKYRGLVKSNLYIEYLEKMFQVYFRVLDMFISKSSLPGGELGGKVPGTSSFMDSMFNPFKRVFDFFAPADGSRPEEEVNYNVYKDIQEDEPEDVVEEEGEVADELINLKKRIEELEKRLKK